MRKLTLVLTGTAFAVALGALGGLCGSVIAAPATAGGVTDTGPGEAAASGNGLTAEEFSAQSRKILHRSPRRVRIYGPREPGPNSVRICSSYYEYEYRLSGTVIVPRENCYWSG
jgi:hypothetical protein